MLLTIAAFELKKRLGMLSTWVYFAVFFAIAFLLVIAAGGAFESVSVGAGSDKVHANSPYSLQSYIASTSYFGVIVIAAVFGQAVHQDFEARIDPLFFTLPISKRAYLGGRFLGALGVMFLVFASIGLGAAAGTVMPFVEASNFGPAPAGAYLWPYLVSVLPNLLFTGAIFFSLATLGRRMMPVYVGSVLLLMGYLIAQSLVPKLDNKPLAALLDPFGLTAAHFTTEYWTVAERNTRLVPLAGSFLVNRILWSAVALGLLGFTFTRFRFSHDARAGKGGAAMPIEAAAVPPPLTWAKPRPGGNAGLLLGLTWLSFKETVKNVYFLVITLAGVLFMVVASRLTGAIFGTATYPVTYLMVEIIGGTFGLFVLINVAFLAGELVWRERDAGVDQLFDTLPIPTWLPYLSKLLALFGVQLVLLAVVLLTGLAIQTVKGYHHYELGLYFTQLFGFTLVEYCLICVLAIAVHTIVQQKYVGHFVMVLYYASTLFMGALGLEHNLYKFGSNPGYTYSDMNGYGHFFGPVLWFDAYWAAFALLLAVGASLFWARGVEVKARSRWQVARQRFRGTPRVLGVVAVLAWVGLGGFIYWNTNILNKYRTGHDREAARAEYEKLYKPLAKVPQPRIVDEKVQIDIFPEKPALRARGTYALVNKNAEPVKTVYVNVPEDHPFQKLSLGGMEKPTKCDERFGLCTFELPAPLAPGAATTLDFDIAFDKKGFSNGGRDTAIVGNGTFFHSSELVSLGYQEGAELSDDGSRKKYDLSPKERMAPPSDLEARKNTYIASDADWIGFEATVSTAPDQIAIAPGYLQKEWTENGRRYFQYKMDAKILSFWSVLSARYAVKKDVWKGVALEIYYHPGHDKNLDQMMKGMKEALEYCSNAFGPYQHRQARILEFPRYQQFAQSFPNTIPYSEAVGFIAKVDPDDKDDLDYPFYVTAHEIAHQWWAHQVIGGNVQGATLLSESLAEYSALMVMKHEFGADKMRRFLKYDLDRYLIGRAMERKKERPLALVENQQYIHYSKGSLAFYLLADYLGEEKLNAALKSFADEVRYQEPPYTTGLALVMRLKKAAPAELQYLVDDLFTAIVLYDNRALEARATEKDGKWEVKVKVSLHKVKAADLGDEKDADVDDLFEVGAVDDKGMPIFLEKRRLAGKEAEVTMVMKELPAKAGIDPMNKLIDKKPDDNLVRVEKN